MKITKHIYRRKVKTVTPHELWKIFGVILAVAAFGDVVALL